MIKNIVIWLVKLLKLEEIFVAEFKAVVKQRLNAKLSNLENVVHSIEIASGLIGQIEKRSKALPFSILPDNIRKEFNVIESGVKQVRQEIADEIENL